MPDETNAKTERERGGRYRKRTREIWRHRDTEFMLLVVVMGVVVIVALVIVTVVLVARKGQW